MAAKDKPIVSPAVAVIAVLLIAGGGVVWYLNRPASPAGGLVLTPEAKEYVKHLKLSDVEMKATSNALDQRVVEITGKIGNNGGRELRTVEINCVFYDPYGQLVLRERVAIVRAKTGGLKPGETRSFRLPFDTIPDSWNQAMPQLVIARIVFG